MDEELGRKVEEMFGKTVNTKTVFPFAVHRDTLYPELFGKLICRETEDMVFCFLEILVEEEDSFSSNFITKERAEESGLKYKDLVKLAHDNMLSFGGLKTDYVDSVVVKDDDTDGVDIPKKFIFYKTNGTYFVSGIIFYPDIMADIMSKCCYNTAYVVVGSTNEIFFLPMTYTPDMAHKLLDMINSEWQLRNPDHNNTVFPVTRKIYLAKADGSITKVEV